MPSTPIDMARLAGGTRPPNTCEEPPTSSASSPRHTSSTSSATAATSPCPRRWRKDVNRGRASGRARTRYLELRYEDLVRDPEGELRRVCAFCSLRYADAMLRYHETAEARLSELGDKMLPDGHKLRREVRLAIHERTASPPQPERAGRWRREMSAGDLAEFEAVAGDLLVDLGYELGAVTSPPPHSRTP
jgi:hypothetical protein